MPFIQELGLSGTAHLLYPSPHPFHTIDLVFGAEFYPRKILGGIINNKKRFYTTLKIKKKMIDVNLIKLISENLSVGNPTAIFISFTLVALSIVFPFICYAEITKKKVSPGGYLLKQPNQLELLL